MTIIYPDDPENGGADWLHEQEPVNLLDLGLDVTEFGLNRQTFHLQGQHDQQTHAGGRSAAAEGMDGDEVTPASRRGWKPLKGVLSERPIEFDEYENHYRVTAANGAQVEARVFTYNPDSPLRSPAWQQRIADGLNGVADGYDMAPLDDGSVPHLIVMDELPFGLPDVAEGAIAFVSSNAPRGPIPNGAPFDATQLRSNTVVFNATPRGREMWDVMEERAAEIMMPSVSSTSVANYTGIHEYGHTRAQDDFPAVLNNMYGNIRPLSLSDIPREWKALSPYGKTNPAEAHAEAFAEWVLSDGVTDNAASRFYADQLGWGQEREEAIAASAGLRAQWVWCFDSPHGGTLITKAPEGSDFHLQGQHDQQSHAGGRASTEFEPITADEARGNSRPVSSEEFQRLAAIGRRQIDELAADTQPIDALDDNWSEIQQGAFNAAQESWGGATINARTGEFLDSDADRYALTVKDPGFETVSIPEGASQAEFEEAMTAAKEKFRPILERRDHYLGVFHDDDLNRIDFDPVTVVDTLDEVETIGAATRAIGGAYNFADGNGYWPPHVDEELAVAASAGMGDVTKFKGPAEWKRQAKQLEGAPDAPEAPKKARKFHVAKNDDR